MLSDSVYSELIVAFPLRLKGTEVFAEAAALKVAGSVTVPPFSARLAPDFERLTVLAAAVVALARFETVPAPA